MQNLTFKLRQMSIISKKPGFLLEKLETLTSSNYHSIYFFAEIFAHIFYLIMSTQGCLGFLFCLDVELLMKM